MPTPLSRFTVAVAVLAIAAPPSRAAAQQTPRGASPQVLTLDDAVRIAERESQSVRIARAGSDRAAGQQLQARSQLFPQIAGSLSYQRSLQVQFQEIAKRVGSGNNSSSSGGSGSDTSSNGGDNSFAALSRVFASPSTMILGVTATQTVYAGGRLSAGIAAADAGVRAADLGARAARAQLVYDVAEAYFDAQVADQLLAIADSSLAQTERALRQTQLARDVGNTAEYDLIRARVQRDNTQPGVIGARTQRDIAFLRLRQLLKIPPDRPIALATRVDALAPAATTQLRATANVVAVPDTSAGARISVRQAQENVRAQANLLTSARGQRLPAVSLSTNYQRFAYPSSGIFEDRLRYYFPNWTVSLGVSMPLFTGGRQRGDEMVAEANLVEARERYQQTLDGAVLDAQVARAQLDQAESRLAATAGTDEQAAKAYSIAEVRFAEGIATQLELTQARVDLETSRANRVQAARDVALARLRVALLNDLPLGATLTTSSAPAGAGAR